MTLWGQTSTQVPHSQQLPKATTSFIICLNVTCDMRRDPSAATRVAKENAIGRVRRAAGGHQALADETKRSLPMPSQHNPEDHEPSRSRRALRAMRSQVQPGSFPLLLVATLLLYVLNGLAVESTSGRILARVARTGVSGAAIYVLSANRVTLWLGVFALGLELTFGTRLWAFDPWVNRVVQDATTMAFLCYVIV